MAASSPEPEKLEDRLDDEASKEEDGVDDTVGGSETPDGDGKEDDEVEEQEDENDGDEEEEDADGDDDGDGALEIGGPIETDAYGLLDGVFEDPESGAHTRVTIPLTRFPATLGRSHDTSDPHFFGLGKKKALSRKQCKIYYRDAQGGKVQWDPKLKGMSYQNPDGTLDSAKLLHTKAEDLPQGGFFVIECLGKNRILVNKERVDQGNSAVLKSGASIRISSYMLYFLLPKDAAPSKPHFIPNPSAANASTKRKKSPPTPPMTSNSSVASSKENPSAKKTKATMGASFQAELDTLPVETLLQRMTTAINKNQWERRHQLIGSTISLHSVRDAAMDPEIQEEALDGGVSRSDVMTWVETSPKYKKWVEQMMTKMEARSYQAAITKSLLKAGYTRTGSSGRYIKWFLPADIEIKPVDGSVKKKPKKEKVEEEEEEEGGGGEGGEEDGGGEEEEEEEGGDEEEEEEEEDEEDEVELSDDQAEDNQKLQENQKTATP